jgi:hypothetical protein
MKPIYVAANPLDAELVRSFLESRGIAATVRGDALFSLRGQVPMTVETLPTVWTHDAETDRARTLVEAYQRDDASLRDGARSWRCPRCAEWLQPQFASCWRCNTMRR